MVDFYEVKRAFNDLAIDLDGYVVEMLPEPSEGHCGGCVLGDDGFIWVSVAEGAGVEDGAEVLKGVFVVGASEQFGVVSAPVFGFLYLEGEPGTRALAGDGEGGVPGEDELFGVNHGKNLSQSC